MTFLFGATQASEIAAVCGPMALYFGLIEACIRGHRHDEGSTFLLVISICGVAVSFVSLLSGPPVRYAALAFFALFLIAVLAPVFLDAFRGRRWQWPAAAVWIWERPRSLLIGFGLVLVAALGTVIGAAVFGDGTTVTTVSAAASGRYRISGTCVNGSCYVNECATPAVCGSENEGELKEETAVDIVCQTKGEMTKAPNDRHSYVWDRLSTALYVSDLYVSGTRSGKFADLPRCAGG